MLSQATYRTRYQRHVPRTRTIALRQYINIETPLVSPTSSRAWNQIARLGQWKGHGKGPFEMTTSVMEDMCRNFERQVNPLPIRYGHPEEETPAAGWIHELEIRNGELWALCEWTDEAAQYIRAGAYRYCSMVFAEHSRDRETDEDVGAELYELGVVNSPFMDAMQPLMCSRFAARGSRRKLDMSIDKKKIMEALGELPDDAGPEQFMKALDAALLMQEAMEPAKEEAAPEAPEEMAATPVPEISAMSATMPATVVSAAAEPPTAEPKPSEDGDASAKDQLAKLLESMFGTDLQGVLAFLKENGDKLAALAKGSAPAAADDKAAMSHEVEAVKLSAVEGRAESLAAQVAALTEKLASYEAQEKAIAEKALEQKVDDAIKCGHILPTHRDTFIKLGRLDRAELESELSKFAAAPAVPTKRLVSAPVSGSAPTDLTPLDETEKQILRLMSNADVSAKRTALERHRSKHTTKLNGRA